MRQIVDELLAAAQVASPSTYGELMRAAAFDIVQLETDVSHANFMRRMNEVMPMIRSDDDLDWARWPWERCRARFDRDDDVTGVYWGRCDLKRGHVTEHALERGFDTLRFRVVVR